MIITCNVNNSYLLMNIFTMLSSSRGSKKLTIGNVIKFSNYKSSVLHTELRVSTLVLFIYTAFLNSTSLLGYI